MLKEEKCKEEVVKNAEEKVVEELQEVQKEMFVSGEGGVRGAGGGS